MTTTNETLRALLLDGDVTALRVLGCALERRGVDVRAAGDGARGLEILLDELLSLDVLVVDLDLPARDGWSFLRLVRGAGGERDLAVVVLARDASPALRGQLASLGADAVVDRAAAPEVVVAEVERAVLRRRAGAPVAPAPFLAAALGALRAAPRVEVALGI
jgi:DNA-binding response OmpR family regulator